MNYAQFKQKIRPFPVFSTSMLGTLTRDVSTLKVQLSQWKKKGFIKSLRQGLYVLNPEDRRMEPSSFYLANQMFIPSYVSLESALSYHGLIPEFVGVITSVTPRKTCRFENDFGRFEYRHVTPSAYGGFQSVVESEVMTALVAYPEKAVTDFIYLNLSGFDERDRSVFTESYRFQNSEDLSAARLRRYAQRYPSKKLAAVIDLFIKEML